MPLPPNNSLFYCECFYRGKRKCFCLAEMEGKVSEGFKIRNKLFSSPAEAEIDPWANVFTSGWNLFRPTRNRFGEETCFAADAILDQGAGGGYRAILKLTLLSSGEEFKVKP